MSKISKLLFLLLIFTTLQLFWFSAPTYADDLPKCSTNVIPHGRPAPLIGTDRKATFEILVDDTLYSGWAMEFDCGGWGFGPFGQKDKAAAKVTGSKIYRTIDKTNPNPCEFAEGDHTINVFGVNQLGGEVPYCKANYRVESALRYWESKCELDINPKANINADSTILRVTASKLPKTHPHDGTDLYYKLYVDIKEPIPNFYAKPFQETSTTDIPSEFMAVYKTHSVTVRQTDVDGKSPKDPIPACKVSYTVGTKDKPGSVIVGGTGSVPFKPCIENCTSAGGATVPGCGLADKKNPDPRGPGIPTAIGCIHTSPPELAKDFLTFLVGIGGGLAFLMMLFGAFQMMTSAGNPETLAAGRSRLTSAVIGLLFIIFSILFLQIIGVDILKIPGFEKSI